MFGVVFCVYSVLCGVVLWCGVVRVRLFGLCLHDKAQAGTEQDFMKTLIKGQAQKRYYRRQQGKTSPTL